ncbi:MAG: GNAT family N-acetyltransferase [Lachnospiraceae bacterium]|nr:GNAT family N-acetyltransferase [Lachnospiraceae bacterium]
MEETRITNSIYEENWWLDTVAGNQWERIIVKKSNGEIAAAFPIYKTKKFGFKVLETPPLSPTCGIYFEKTGAKQSKRLEKTKDMIYEILKQLPNKYNHDFRLDINNDYFLPFYWKGYKITPLISYQIENLSDLDTVWKGFKENIKTDIRKAQKNVKVYDDRDIDVLVDICRKTYKRQDRKLPWDIELMKKLDGILTEKRARKLLCAVDAQGNIHAVAYFIYDNRRCYYFKGGTDEKYRNSGAMSLLVWEGIKFAAEVSEIFDFEGSMVESIERFDRGFGGTPQVYYRVTKQNFLLSFFDYIKPNIKRLLGYKI